MTNDARSLIMGTSAPAMAFTYVNDSAVGKIITEPKAVQQTVYDPRNPQSKELAFWPSGDPKMQVIFQIQTEFRNYEGIKNPDRSQPDSGTRTIYLKGKHMERATAEAIRAAGADWLEIGGMVYYRFTGEDMSSLAGVKPKLFEVRYQPPQQSPQPPQHFQQQAAPGQQGYGAQQAQHYPGGSAPGGAAQPGWQQPGWNPQQVVPGVPTGFGGPGTHAGPPFAQSAPQAAAVPSHHGSPEAMPDWARPNSAPPVSPTSAPPAPALSTLDLIRQGQNGTSDYGSVEPVF